MEIIIHYPVIGFVFATYMFLGLISITDDIRIKESDV